MQDKSLMLYPTELPNKQVRTGFEPATLRTNFGCLFIVLTWTLVETPTGQ